MAADAATIVTNWQRAMTSGTAAQKYKDAIARVNVNPMELAAAAVESGKYLQGVQASIASGKMAKKLRGASQASWKNNAMGPGAQNFQTGAQKGLPKVQAASAAVAAAGAAGQAAAKSATGAAAKMIANMNAIRQAHGYSALG